MPGKRVADMTPEQVERYRAARRAYKQKYRKTPAFKAAKARANKRYKERGGDTLRERENARQKQYRVENPERFRAAQDRYKAKKPEAVDAAERRRSWRKAKPSQVRALLLRLQKQAPRYDCHEDIVSAALVLVMQGVPEADALPQAKKEVTREANRLRYAKDIDDCFWLHEEEVEHADPEDDW